MSTLRRALLRVAVAVSMLAMAGLAGAQDLGRYEGEAAVASQADEARAAAAPAALAQLLVRLSGSRAAAAHPAIAPRLAEAATLIERYRYRALDPALHDVERLALVASFQPAAVDALLAAAGLPAWPEPRPAPVVWLAIDDGRGARLVGSAQAPIVAAMGERARARGLRLTFPLLDLEDQQQIDAERVWQLDAASAQAAAQRYHGGAVLLGKLQRSGDGWRVDWRVQAQGRTLAEDSRNGPEAMPLLAAGAELAADALAREQTALQVDAGPAGRYAILVDDIRSAEDYARLIGYLQRVAVVRALRPARARDSSLLLELDLATGVDGFARMVDGAGVLAALPPQAGEQERRFRLEP